MTEAHPLLQLFKHQAYPHYEELNLGEIIVVKRFNKRLGSWGILQFTPQSFMRYKKGYENYKKKVKLHPYN